jgi:hypothetical protein
MARRTLDFVWFDEEPPPYTRDDRWLRRRNAMLKARLTHVGAEVQATVTRWFTDGKLLVDRSRDPESVRRCAGSQGITGKLTMLDGKTGKPAGRHCERRSLREGGPRGSHPARPVRCAPGG